MDQTVDKTVLKNGVRILSKKIEHAHSVSMGVWVNAGSRDEASEENGLFHFIEHMIFKGTEKRSAFQIAKEFDRIGGQTNAFTSTEHTCYHARVMDTHLETMVEILSDIFLNSVFDPGEVEKERPVILQEIGMIEDNPEDYIYTLMEKNFWGDNSLGCPVIGTRDNIVGFDSEMIKKFFQRFYQPERIVISLAGNFEHERLVDLIGPVFERIQPGEKLPDRVTPEIFPKIIMEQRDLEQVHICIGKKGLSISSPRRYASSLLNTILGGNMSSRLFQEIRERRGLAYSIYSFLSSYMDTGMFGVYAGIAPDKAEKTSELILKEMDKIRTNSIHTDELTGAKEYTKGSILLSSESTDGQMARIAQSEINFGKYISIQEIIENIESVTPDEIIRLAEELFPKSHTSLTLLGSLTDTKPFEDMLQK